MRYEDPAFRTYSANGIRSAESWETRGRAVIDGSTPCISVMARGQDVPLFTRDQTKLRVSSRGPNPHTPAAPQA